MADNCLEKDVNGGQIVPKRRDASIVHQEPGEICILQEMTDPEIACQCSAYVIAGAAADAMRKIEDLQQAVNDWKALAIKAETERDNLRERLAILPIGCPINRNDHNGNPIHVGDELDFNEREWGEPMRFVVQMKDGMIQHPGAPSDLDSWCTIVRKWNEVLGVEVV
jgi:hypothetical protein